MPAPEEVPANAAEAVDRHLELRFGRRPHRVLSGGLSQVKAASRVTNSGPSL